MKIPVEYNGILIVETRDGQVLELLTDNKDISFTAKIEERAITPIKFIKGNVAEEFQKAVILGKFQQIKNTIFPSLKNYYSKDDSFYKAIDLEEKRISSLNFMIISPLAQYYFTTADLLTKGNSSNDPAVNKLILHKLIYDDDRLEQTGFLKQLVFLYFKKELANFETQSEAETQLDKLLTKLLDQVDINTSRGQNILMAALDGLPDKQFSSIKKKYLEKASGLTCQMTDELKQKLFIENALAKGQRVPDIKFNKPVKNIKGLYEILSNKKIIMFWASWCPACNNELPYVKEYYQKFKKDGGEIIAISLDEDINQFNKATKDIPWINYTDLLKWDSPLVDLYGVASTPTFFLLDKNNNLIKRASNILDIIGE